MKPGLLLTSRRAGFLLFLAIAAACFTPDLRADPPPDYYAPATDLTGGPLKQALHGIIATHTVIPYASLINPLANIWRDPANSSNILLSYSHTSVSASSSWNREHLWPRARGNSDQAGPDDSDLFHVVPTDISVNAERGSLYFDESDPGDPAYRIPAHPLAPQTSRDADSWQPPPEERGDIARALFYMDVCYDGQVAQTTDMELVSFPPSGPQMGRLNTLLLWNEQDPPDAAERSRNDLIYTTYQHNRNPFIDHPEWVTAIWGSGVPNTPGSRPIARVELIAASAVEAPLSTASFQILLNQFAGAGGLNVSFTMSGTATLAEYTLSGSGLTYDPATGHGTVFIPENYSSSAVTLSPVNDGLAEPAETAIAALVEDPNYTVVPGTTAQAIVTITDAPRLPLSWNFNASSYANPLPANTGGGSISFSGWRGTLNYFTGLSSSTALALVGNAGNGSWIDINLSMTGYSDLALSFWTRGSNGGFTTGTWSSSSDGVTFATLPNVNTATTGTNFVQRNVNFSGLTGLTDAPNVTLRYTLSGATGSAGNNRIDELTVTANPVASGNALRTVSIAAADASASELMLDPGTFSVQLNGLAPAGGLDVVISFAGTATAPGASGADYTLEGLSSYDAATRTGHLFFPEGQRTALINLTPLADDLADSGETVIASLASSESYLLGSYYAAIITISEPLPNDNFSNAISLTGTPASTTGTNSGATLEPGEPPLSSGGKSVWWKWQAPADGVVTIDTRGSNFDTYLGVYAGVVVNSLTTFGTNDDSGGNLTSLLNLRVQLGRTYYIDVASYGQTAGNIVLNINFAPVPTVQISAIVAAAKERGGIPAKVRFTLSNSVALTTTLVLDLSGTATADSDYTTLSGSLTSITVPANATSADLDLLPIADTNTVEQTETITVLLANSTLYHPESYPLNLVRLTLEDDSPYTAAWINEHPGLTPAAAAPSGDLDGDGIPSLLEYLTNHNPAVADGDSLLRISFEMFVDPADDLEKLFTAIRFTRRHDTGTASLVLETTASLSSANWQPGGILISTTPQPNSEVEEVLYRSALPLSDPSATTFFRLRATFP